MKCVELKCHLIMPVVREYIVIHYFRYGLVRFTVCTFKLFNSVTGQYDGLSKPMPEYHAKIKGFDERVCGIQRK